MAEKDRSADTENDGHSYEELKEILKLRRVAVVGISRDPTKPSHYVPKYLKDHGYEILSVNPFCDEVLGLKCFRSLLDVEKPIDIVQIFRPSEDVPPVVDVAVRKNVKVIWLQEGIHNPQSEEEATRHGVQVVWNRCMMKERVRLYGGKPRVSLSQI